MTQDEADKAQQWAGMDGVTAYQLIERHAEDWHEIGEMMNAWLRANVAVAVDRAAQVACNHDPYQGRCAHCDVEFKNGRPVRAAARGME